MSDVTLKDIRYRGDQNGEYENWAYDPESGPTTPSEKEKQPMPGDGGGSAVYTTSPQEIRVADDEDEEDEDQRCLAYTACVEKAHGNASTCYAKSCKYITWVVLVILAIVYFIYFGFAMAYQLDRNVEESIRLLVVTCVVVFFMLIHFIRKCVRMRRKRQGGDGGGCTNKAAKHGRLISWILVAALFLALMVFVFVDVFANTKQYYNLVSLAGIVIFVLVMYIFSYSPAKVPWRAVVWGLGLQLLFAVLILRWDVGYTAFQWIGDQVAIFLDYSDAGSSFLFGEGFREHYFAFKVLPTIVFFSTVISILYYWGVMQSVIHYIAVVMQFAMGTTAGESLNAAGNIFVGQTEAPLMIRPLLPTMTRSEIHAVMTGGFATIAGGVFAAYVGFGVPPNHLISASVMSAPAALAMAKLFYPETEKSKNTAKDVRKLPPSDEFNFLSAAGNGASQSIMLVANIAVNLLAFISLLQFIDATLTWFGHRVGWYDPELTFSLICSYVFFPIPLIMGVDLSNCRQVAQLIGIKTFLNEFVAYTELGVLISNREIYETHLANNGTYTTSFSDIILDPRPGFNRTVLEGGILTERSEVISTYALCGFANIGSIGIQLGALGAMAPERKNDLAAVALRAMIAGNVACFMTACIAGLFFQG